LANFLFFYERFAMAISSVSSSTILQTPPKGSPVESTEATVGGKDIKKDGDADDAGAPSASAGSSVVNNLGQEIGRNLSVTA
jgi:hypothetical protein